jgi:hypothetical protein
MSERHWPRPALATTALALLGATAATGHQAITAEQLEGALPTSTPPRPWPSFTQAV